MEEKIHIGVSGQRGSFTEEATKYYCDKDSIDTYSMEYLVSVENVLQALQEKKVDLGVFPLENSNGGIVIEAVHAMSKHIFVIEKIFEIDIHHCLLVKPNVTVHAITKITSHDQALKQCRMYLKRKWSGVELEEYADTALAAKDLGSGVLGDGVAIIAPKSCAELYGLHILEESIQDLKFNFTTFIAAR